MISLFHLPVHRCYTGNTVCLEVYEYGNYWWTYVSCSIISALLPRMQSIGGDIWLELCMSYNSSCYHSPPLSPLAPIKSRMETFWYWLTQVHLENGH